MKSTSRWLQTASTCARVVAADFGENQPLYCVCVYVCESERAVAFTTTHFHNTACRQQHRATSGQRWRFGSLFLELETSNRVGDFQIVKAFSLFLSDDSPTDCLMGILLDWMGQFGWRRQRESRKLSATLYKHYQLPKTCVIGS